MIKMAANLRTQDVLISEDWSFDSLLLSKHTTDGLKVVGFRKPSPVQAKSIPLGKCGLDLIVQAKSGTGKTCVFAVVALEMVLTTSHDPQVIVLAPTREIAAQIYEFFCAIGSCTQNLHCNVFIGGTAVGEDKKKLLKCQIVIGTPGRVKSLIDAELLQTDAIRLFILDEADKLLEPGSFQEQINWIYSTLPKNKQVLALSATYPEYLAKHLINYMNEPAHIRLDTERPALLGIKQLYMTVEHHHLPHAVFEKKAKNLASFLRRYPFQQCMVFSNYQARAQMLADMLSELGWPASCIAGSQSQTDRFKAMKELKDFKCRVLISTDLTSRGIDCDKVDLVINLDMPWDCETYLHRVGRAGRFGNYGVALSLVAKGKEEEKLMYISNEIKYTIEKISDMEKVADIASDLLKSWQSQKDSSDLQNISLNGREEYFSNSQQENFSEYSNDEQNLLLHDDDEDKHVISKSSKEISCCASRTLLDSPDVISEASLKDDQKQFSNSSHNLLCNSQDSSKSFDSLDNLKGESSFHLDTLLPCKFDLSSTNTSTSHMDELGRQKNSTVSEQQNKLETKNSSGLVEDEVIKFVENEKINCTFIMSNSKSLEKTSSVEASPQENVTDDAIDCQTPLLSNEKLEEQAADGNEEETEEKHKCFSKDPMEIAVIELENVLGNLVCEDLIDSGARMLHEYYLSEGVLRKNTGESKVEKLESHKSMTRLKDGYEPEVILARSKGNSTVCETRTANGDQNLAWSQDFLSASAHNHAKSLQEASFDQQQSDSSSLHSHDELLQSEEDLSVSETAFSNSETGFVKSSRDLFASCKIMQASVDRDVGQKETVYHRTDIEPKINESRFSANGELNDAFAQNAAIPYEVASDIGMLPMKGVYSAGFKHELKLNDIEKNPAGSDTSVEILQGERHRALYRDDGSLLLGKEKCNDCIRTNESRPRESRKFIKHSANSRMPHSKQNIARPLFDCSRQHLNSIPDNEVVGSNRYWKICDTWYGIYRKQVAWMKYHSWQYRKSAYYCNTICYNCL